MTRSNKIPRTIVLLVLAGVLALTWPQHLTAQNTPQFVITSSNTKQYPQVDIYIGTHDVDMTGLASAPQITAQEHIGDLFNLYTPSVSVESPGITLIVLVDLHRRMRGIGLPGKSRIETVREAIQKLTQALVDQNTNHSKLGIIGYSSKPVEITRLQPLTQELVESLAKPGSGGHDPFTIAPKTISTPANDPNDPNAKSALSAALEQALTTLATESQGSQAIPEQQQVILILGSTCDDVNDALSQRKDINCEPPPEVLTKLRTRLSSNMLTIFGVGVGSDDPKQPLVDPNAAEPGFEYTGNFNEIQHFSDLLQGRFARLPAHDGSDSWSEFVTRIITPILHQTSQIKLSFRAKMLPKGVAANHANLLIALPTTVLTTTYDIPPPEARPHIEILLNETPVTSDVVTLPPGQSNLTTRYIQGGTAVATADLNVSVPTSATVPTSANNSKTQFSADELDRLSLYFGLLAFLLAIVALLYWLWTTRSSQVAEQFTALGTEQPIDVIRFTDAPTQHYLEVIASLSKDITIGKIFPVYGPVAVIGSDDQNAEIWLNSRFIELRHAELTVVKDNMKEHMLVRDLNSKYGTWINDTLLGNQPQPIEYNQLLTIGRTVFVYRDAMRPPTDMKTIDIGRGKTQILTTQINTTANNPGTLPHVVNSPQTNPTGQNNL